MSFDPAQLNQLLNHVHYPIDKANLVQFAQQHNANDQVMTALNHLPDKTFNSAQDVQNELQNVKNVIGNLGNFKL